MLEVYSVRVRVRAPGSEYSWPTGSFPTQRTCVILIVVDGNKDGKSTLSSSSTPYAFGSSGNKIFLFGVGKWQNIFSSFM